MKKYYILTDENYDVFRFTNLNDLCKKIYELRNSSFIDIMFKEKYIDGYKYFDIFTLIRNYNKIIKGGCYNYRKSLKSYLERIFYNELLEMEIVAL